MTAKALAEQLAATLGDSLPPTWQEAYRAVPRHLFVPDQAWRSADGARDEVPIDRRADPQGWLEAVYSQDVIVTQMDDGKVPAGQPGRHPTSSCSMPYMVFTMLDLLDVQPRHRVMEIGTGTGWNAGLLAYRLGDREVVSVEVDPEVAERARKALAGAGLHPLVVTGDGAAGHPPGAPYDRVIATCTVYQVPYPWVGQTRPGGLIVTPVGAPLGSGAIATLTVASDGTASGHFQHGSAFMPMRAQRFTAPDEPDDFGQRADRSAATMHPADVFEKSPLLAISRQVSGCKVGYDSTDGSVETVWLLAADSWASVDVASGVVRQLGTRRLWDEVEAAYRWWVAVGHPDYTRFGVSVTAERQWVWLDEPANEVPELAG